MAYVRREYPAWSWSFSRQQTFDSCSRKYYYQYYGSHNGWEDSAPKLAAMAYRLKKLGNLYTVLGDAVHQTAERVVRLIRRGRPIPDQNKVEEMVREHLRTVWRASRDRKDLFMAYPNRVPMLHEFYYGEGPTAELVARINERITKCAQSLTAAQSLAELAAEGTELVACEQFDTFELHGTPVYAVPDLLYHTADGQWVIVDWKTGRQEEQNTDQVALYAFYVSIKHNVPVQNIKARLEYLETGTVLEMDFDEANLAEIEERAQVSMEEMRSYLADRELNKAKPIESFPLTSDRYKCSSCSFLELCAQELRAKYGQDYVPEVAL